MSATNRGRIRERDDAYYTPAWCVRALLRAVRLPGGFWLEPCAGEGAIIRAVAECHPGPIWWRAVEKREECRAALEAIPTVRRVAICDSLTCPPDSGHRASVAITNPPYSLAMEFVEHCLTQTPIVVMLLRLNWLGSQRRAAFLRSHMPDVYVLPRRPSFVRGATDACEYMWAVWGPIASGVGRVQVLDLEDCR